MLDKQISKLQSYGQLILVDILVIEFVGGCF